MNEHIEYFNRWQSTYLMWAYSNFDRIVAETVNKHKEEMKKEKFDNSDFAKFSRLLFQQSNSYFEKMANELMKDNVFVSGTNWTKGHVVKIKFPGTFSPS